MADIAVNTSQNVNINFATASVGERMAAFMIDMLIKGAFVATLFFIFVKIFHIQYFLDGLDQWSAGAILILITLPIYIYTLVLESLMEGQTPGKKVMKIRVVKIDGYQASFGDYLMRWFFRIIDILLDSGVVAIISIIISKNNQRLGDMASGTAVISLKQDVKISHTILENLNEDYQPVFPQVVGLDDNDVRIIKENYQKILATQDRALTAKLALKVKEILKIEINPQEYTDRQFIDKIIKDYNYYTGKDA